MTVVDHNTGELLDVSYADVKRSITLARESGTKFFDQIVWQVENRAWLVMGYADWDEMRETEYGDMGVAIPRADRPEVVSRLRRAGMTQQDIAETIGVSRPTVVADLNAGSDIEQPVTITNARGQERPTKYAVPAPRAIDHAALAEAAIAEFPDLAYYRDEAPDLEHCWRLAEKLREYRDRQELPMRLDTLRRSIAVDRAKRNGTYRIGTTAVMNDAGEYEMQPLAEQPMNATCPTCGQKVSD